MTNETQEFRRMRTTVVLGAVLVLLPLGSVPTVRAEQNGRAPDGTALERSLGGPAPLARDVLLRAVLARNPNVLAARSAWRAAVATARAAGTFDDPSFSYSFGPASIDDEDVRFAQIYELRQPLPFPGKLSLREAVAAAEADAAAGAYETTRRQLELIASLLFDDYYAVERSLEINAQHHALVEDLRASAEAHYVAGHAGQDALVAAEVEMAHIEHERIKLESRRRIVRAQINGLLHQRTDSPLASPPQELEASPPPGALEALEREALAARPELAASDSLVDAADAGIKLARREYFPDFAVGGSYNNMWDRSEHRYMVGLTVEIPLQLGRRNAELERAEAERIERRSRRDALADDILVQLREAYERTRENEHVVHLYRDRLIPASRDRVAAARSGFEAGKGDFDALIAATRNLRTVELEYQLAIAALHQGMAELDRATGRSQLPRQDGGAS